MNTRKEQLLRLVVENYVENAEPIGSKFLVETSDLGVSGATIRNEMRDLESEGYLTHPHTSAGRIPTEVGYRYYVENIMKSGSVKKKIKDELEIVLNTEEESVKKIKLSGKFVAEFSNNAVIIAFENGNIYYTGISNLFSQPEFRDYAHVASFSTIFDQVEDRLESIYDLVENNTEILIGENNPLGKACSMIATRFGENGLFALMGPMRMDYSNNVSLVNHIGSLFN